MSSGNTIRADGSFSVSGLAPGSYTIQAMNPSFNGGVVDMSAMATTKIVTSYVGHHTVGAGQLSDLITTIHRTLGQLAPTQADTQPPSAINLVDYQIRRRPILDGLTSEYQIAA